MCNIYTHTDTAHSLCVPSPHLTPFIPFPFLPPSLTPSLFSPPLPFFFTLLSSLPFILTLRLLSSCIPLLSFSLWPHSHSLLALTPPSLFHQIGFLLQAADLGGVDGHYQSAGQSPHWTQVSQEDLYSRWTPHCDPSFLTHHGYLLLPPICLSRTVSPSTPPSLFFLFLSLTPLCLSLSPSLHSLHPSHSPPSLH